MDTAEFDEDEAGGFNQCSTFKKMVLGWMEPRTAPGRMDGGGMAEEGRDEGGMVLGF